jgi:hypothetical protein
MARGWESKSVEEQMEDSRKDKESSQKGSHFSAKSRDSRERENLLLARTRLINDIEATENPRYRQFLQASLAAIEEQLSQIS